MLEGGGWIWTLLAWGLGIFALLVNDEGSCGVAHRRIPRTLHLDKRDIETRIVLDMWSIILPDTGYPAGYKRQPVAFKGVQ